MASELQAALTQWIRDPASNNWLTRADRRWRIGQQPDRQWQVQQHVDGPGETWSWKGTFATDADALLWINGYERGVRDMGQEIIATIEEWIEEA